MRSPIRSLGAFALSAFFLTTGVDAFWRLNCAKIMTGRIDPLVNPGAIAQHAHTIVGGSNIGVNSTYNTLLNSDCSSCEVQADKSAYWTPLLYYQYPNGSFIDVPHGGAVAYYLSRGILAKQTIPFPKGFMMLSGDKGARSYDNHTFTYGNATYPGRPIADRVSFACLPDGPPIPEQPWMFTTNCLNGMRAQIHFQSCWNGVDLYKADNSHVAYLSDIDNGICPPTHPHVLPHLFLETNYAVSQVPDQQPGGRFVFSQGDPTGYGFHGDFQNGWQASVLAEAINTCLYNEGSFGTIDECPALLKTDTNAYNYNCPEKTSPIDEKVRGLLDKLPGCITVTDGPAAAPNSAMSCPQGVAQPRLTSTKDSTPKATAMPVPGTLYGLPNQLYLGCYNDSAGGIRALNAKSIQNYTAMTPQWCQKYCMDNGYRLSGVEYAQECHCDNFINPTARSGQSQCTWNCGGTMTLGGKQEICGGYGMINISNNTDASFNATGSNADSAGNAQTYAPAAPFGDSYQGCYSDAGLRTLTGKNVQWNNMSIEICQDYCSQGAGFQYYGLEYGYQCWCGNGIANSGTLLTPSSNPSNNTCQMRCRGKGDQICGGPNALSLYNNTGYVSPAPAATVGRYDSQGCYSDPNQGGRILQGASTTDPKMDNQKCVKFCLGKGFHYAGIEYGNECYCGNEIRAQNGAKAIDCPVLQMLTCPNNNKQWCGGPKIMNVWYNPDPNL